MPKEKQYYIDLPKMLKADSLDKLMFAYILGMQRALPGQSLTRCMDMFMEDFLLHEDNYPKDHGLQAYYRMLKFYRIYRKT